MILLVGDKPSSKMELGAEPFHGASCEDRLLEWIFELGIRRYALENASNFTYLSIITGPISAKLMEAIIGGYPIIALGNNASKALCDIPHFKLPHPSGRNRQINDKAFIASKLDECRKYIAKVTA